MQLLNLIFPIVSGATVVMVYLFILIRRKQKLDYIESHDNPELAHLKIYDENEKYWWTMGMAIVLITYAVFMLLLSKQQSGKSTLEHLVFGIFLWGVLAFIGSKIMPKSMYQ